jgi:hypothetical protein
MSQNHTVLSLLLTASLCIISCGDDSGSADPTPNDTGTPDATPDTSPQTITVSGRVIRSSHSPIEGIQIGLISDRNTASVSGPNGQFTFEDVDPPYDLVTISRNDRASAVVYRNLRSPDPTLHHPADFNSSASATADGSLSDGFHSESSPPDFDTTGGLVPASDANASEFRAFSFNPDGTFSVSPTWFQTDSITATLAALQWETDSNDHPSTYTGFGRTTEISFNDGDTLNQIDLPLSTSVTDVSRNISIEPPADFQFSSGAIFGLVDGQPTFPITNISTPNSTWTLPQNDALSASLFAELSLTSGSTSGRIFLLRSNIQQSSDPLTIDVPDAPAFTQPANNATGIDTSSTFSWQDPSDVTHLLGLFPDNSFELPQIFIITDDDATTIPDLSAFGFSLPADTDYTAQLIGVAPASTVDDAATPRWADTVSYATLGDDNYAPFRHSFTITAAPSRTITTASE